MNWYSATSGLSPLNNDLQTIQTPGAESFSFLRERPERSVLFQGRGNSEFAAQGAYYCLEQLKSKGEKKHAKQHHAKHDYEVLIWSELAKVVLEGRLI